MHNYVIDMTTHANSCGSMTAWVVYVNVWHVTFFGLLRWPFCTSTMGIGYEWCVRFVTCQYCVKMAKLRMMQTRGRSSNLAKDSQCGVWGCSRAHIHATPPLKLKGCFLFDAQRSAKFIQYGGMEGFLGNFQSYPRSNGRPPHIQCYGVTIQNYVHIHVLYILFDHIRPYTYIHTGWTKKNLDCFYVLIILLQLVGERHVIHQKFQNLV